MKHSLVLAICLLVLAQKSAQALPIDLIVNGSFENPQISGNWVQYQAGSTDIVGWNVTFGNIDIVQTEWQAFDGIQSIDLVGYVIGKLEQTIPTVSGNQYEVTFVYSNNWGNGGGDALFEAVGQSTLISDTISHWNAGSSDLHWVHYTSLFTADSASTSIRLSALTRSNSGGVVIDNVSVVQSAQAIPEPGSMTLAVLGLGILVYEIRRRAVKA
jgi:choice-of-anchor C domain-containing protein